MTHNYNNMLDVPLKAKKVCQKSSALKVCSDSRTKIHIKKQFCNNDFSSLYIDCFLQYLASLKYDMENFKNM